MAWSIEGEYFENCNCKVVCPCEASMSFEADNERCQVPLICHIERGEKDTGKNGNYRDFAWAA